ncbi:MAG: hypothetical protein ACOH2M_13050 [Cypionkella sp.]
MAFIALPFPDLTIPQARKVGSQTCSKPQKAGQSALNAILGKAVLQESKRAFGSPNQKWSRAVLRGWLGGCFIHTKIVNYVNPILSLGYKITTLANFTLVQISLVPEKAAMCRNALSGHPNPLSV